MCVKSKIKRTLACAFCFMFLMTGCSNSQYNIIQTKDFSLANVNSIAVDYDGDSVTLKKSETDKITVKEYMDKSKNSYFAKISLLDGVLTVTEGARPIDNDVHSRLEIYLPEHYQNSLSLHNTNGSIRSDLALSLPRLDADTTNGTIELSNMSADQAKLTSTNGSLSLKDFTAKAYTVETTNGDTTLDHVTGTIQYTSTNGALTMTDASGSGSFKSTGEGELDMAFSELSGDLSASAKNGKISLTIPQSLQFTFLAETKNGQIQTPFSKSLTLSENTAKGTVGSHPSVQIGLETKNGEIDVHVQ